MASASAGSRYIPITVHFSGAYLEYDLHEQIRGDRLAAESECALHFPGVVILGPVVSHIDEGLGITCPPNALQP
jgi:hypothetical protein